MSLESFPGGNTYEEQEREKIRNRLNASSSSPEMDGGSNLIDEINQSENPLDETLKKIDEGKDISYIMKTLKRINFVDKNNSSYSDPEYRRIKNSEVKKQITEKVLNKEGGWKIVLDNWESINDLTSQDKNSLVQNFKLMIKNSEGGQKEEYYDYLDKKMVEIGTKDPEASILFNEVLRQKEVELDDQLARDLNTNPEKTARDYLSGGYRSGGSNLESGVPNDGNENWGDIGGNDYFGDDFDDGDFGINLGDENGGGEDDEAGSSDDLGEWGNELDGPDEDMFGDPYNLDGDPHGIWGDGDQGENGGVRDEI